MITRLLPLLLLCLTLIPSPALAQEPGQTGIVMGYPTNIAFFWRASETLAIRPDITFTHSSSETESSFLGTSSNDAWGVTVGASALWYTARIDTVRTYFGTRLSYGRNSSDSSSNTGDPATTHNVGLSGSFGAQYTPVRKLSVFGEVGYGFTRGSGKLETPIATTKSVGWNWGPRTAIGVIFHLGPS